MPACTHCASFHCRPTDDTEIINIINSLKPQISSGHDSVNTILLKNIKTYISNSFKIDSKIENDPTCTADQFGSFFSETGSKFA